MEENQKNEKKLIYINEAYVMFFLRGGAGLLGDVVHDNTGK